MNLRESVLRLAVERTGSKAAKIAVVAARRYIVRPLVVMCRRISSANSTSESSSGA